MVNGSDGGALGVFFDTANGDLAAVTTVSPGGNSTNSTDTLENIKIAIVSLYSTLFVVGFLGNVWVISTLLIYFFRPQKTAYQPVPSAATNGRRLTRHTIRGAGSQHLFLYILALSTVDLLVCCTLPMFLAQFLHGNQWFFGPLVCRLYYFVEQGAKLMSINILVVLSLDRYLGLCCSGNYPRVRSVRGAAVLILICGLLAAANDLPVLIYAKIIERESSVNCLLSMPHEVFQPWVLVLFSLGFVSPGLLMLFFYVRVVAFLQRRMAESIVESAIPIKRISCTILLIVIFYFVCWTPFWLVNVVMNALEMDIPGFNTLPVLYQRAFQYGTMSLPYINSGANWIFYALLNRELRQSSWLSFPSHRGSHSAQTDSVRVQSTRRCSRDPGAEPRSPDLLLSERSSLPSTNGASPKRREAPPMSPLVLTNERAV